MVRGSQVLIVSGSFINSHSVCICGEPTMCQVLLCMLGRGVGGQQKTEQRMFFLSRMDTLVCLRSGHASPSSRAMQIWAQGLVPTQT